MREKALADRNRTARIQTNKALSSEKPQGEDWGWVYHVLASVHGIKWPEVLRIPHFMVYVYFEQACYDRRLKNYEAAANNPFN